MCRAMYNIKQWKMHEKSFHMILLLLILRKYQSGGISRPGYTGIEHAW